MSNGIIDFPGDCLRMPPFKVQRPSSVKSRRLILWPGSGGSFLISSSYQNQAEVNINRPALETIKARPWLRNPKPHFATLVPDPHDQLHGRQTDTHDYWTYALPNQVRRHPDFYSEARSSKWTHQWRRHIPRADARPIPVLSTTRDLVTKGISLGCGVVYQPLSCLSGVRIDVSGIATRVLSGQTG